MRRTTLAALCLTAVTFTVAGVAGCQSGEDKAGGSPSGRASGKPAAKASEGPFAGLTGGQIAERALTATSGASSLRMTGDVPDDEGGGTIRIDMALDKRGECAGTLSMNGEGKADVVKTGSTLYMRYDEKFLRAQSDGSSKEETDGVVDMLAGKWTKMAASGADAKDIAGFCDLDSVLADFEDAGSGPGAGVTRGRATTVGGKPALAVSEKDGKDSYTLYVATQGKPYILRLESKSVKDPGTIAFSEYDKPVAATKPTGEILDLDALGG
ncbi:hypothetical protein [Streptomyces geranii]|uniref:hypothetical protein n=1 Tax=Streptomyces geranii TaxID=2058923 RepID=UPI000D04091D|nr:hypothetical protein [Streptomyces geranii]